MRAVALALSVLLFGPVGTAHAGWKTGRAVAIARIAWNDPCGGRVTLRWAQPTSDLELHADAWEMNCAVTYRADIRTTWGEFCTRTLHEFGHAANFRDPTNVADPVHSSDPRSVMYAGEHSELPMVLTEHRDGRDIYESETDPRCAERGRPYLEAHGLLSSRRQQAPPRPGRRPT